MFGDDTSYLGLASTLTAHRWLDEQRALWEGRSNRLVDYVENLGL